MSKSKNNQTTVGDKNVYSNKTDTGSMLERIVNKLPRPVSTFLVLVGIMAVGYGVGALIHFLLAAFV